MQEMAVALLQRQDNIARNKQADREMRLATVLPFQPIEEAFSEEYTEVIETAEELAQDAFAREGVEYDYSQVEWEAPEGMTPEDIADLDEFLAETQVHVQAPSDGGWA